MFGIFKDKSKNSPEEIFSPASGQLVSLSQVPDPTFAEGILGPGVALKPLEGRIVAPADGTVGVMFETGHAVSLTTTAGAELLIHVGIDTVQLNGKHYTARCSAGDTVKKGQLLIEFDKDAIEAEGYNTITPVIVCNGTEYKEIQPAPEGNVSPEDVILTLHK